MPLLNVKVPSVGESISGGILSKWLVADGDTVKKDQPLYEFETDKITSEGTAESAGKISLKAKAGDEVKVGQVVAVIDGDAKGPGHGTQGSEPEKAKPKPIAPSPSPQALSPKRDAAPPAPPPAPQAPGPVRDAAAPAPSPVPSLRQAYGR